MVKTLTQRLGILLALAVVMAATRMHHSLLHHFDALPDASGAFSFSPASGCAAPVAGHSRC